MKHPALVIFFLLLSHLFFTQSGELSKFDCTYSKEIIVPFNYSHDPLVKSKPLLKQKVFYSFRDQFSFWYKIVVKEDHLLNFKVTPLNDSDGYTVFVYHYNEPDICDKVYHQKIFPVKSNFFVGKGSSDFHETEKKFKALKNNTYYISVLNTSLNNCGHRFTLIYGKDSLKVDALHLPCKRDVTSLDVSGSLPEKKQDETKIKLVKKDSVITTPVFFKDTLPGDNTAEETNRFSEHSILILNSKNKKPVESGILVRDKKTGIGIDAWALAKGEFKVTVNKNNDYVIKAEALGYKTKEIMLPASEIKNTSKTEILLHPLKQGESFIMKSIYFVPNTYALRKESKEELEKLLSFMTSNESTVIEIQGHTNGDNRIYKNPGYASLGDEWNFKGSSKKLSEKRAGVIKSFLVNNGVSESRLVAKGYGGSKYLIKDPETNEEAQRNIRVEVYVLKN